MHHAIDRIESALLEHKEFAASRKNGANHDYCMLYAADVEVVLAAAIAALRDGRISDQDVADALRTHRAHMTDDFSGQDRRVTNY